jgi:FKBP-type peptidyl-prolyl cis-trans isomerase FklB
MRKHLLPLVGLVGLLAQPALAAEQPKLQSEKQQSSYSVGYQVGGDFKRQGLEIDAESMVQGVQDALAGTEPALPQEEMRKILVELKSKIVAAQAAKQKEAAEKNLAAGKAFLAENAKRKEVKTLPSGLQYEILTPGKGDSPKATDTVTLHYRGTLIDGTEFDSSYRRGKPMTIGLDRVIKGWTEGVQLMQPGAKYKLFIPPDLGYGERGAGESIPPNSTLVFEVEWPVAEEKK